MGSSTSKTESTAKMLAGLEAYAPGALRSLADTVGYTSQKEFDAAKALAPQQARLETDLYRDFGPELNRIGSNIDRQNQLASSATELAIARGPGSELVSEADRLQRQLDPEFYKSRAVIGDALNNWLSSYNPNAMTEGELEQINRGISSREGSNLTPSAMRTIKNASTFGNAQTAKWKGFGDALSTASSAIPALRSGLTGFEVATRRPLGGNSGENRLSNANVANPANAMQTNFGFANNLMGELGATGRGNVKKTDSTLQNVGTGIGAAASLAGLLLS